ncbi:MAG: Holliday junction branch migration protein RuvA [Patescibacteria group bacterium]|nr:Holliday junction branch migration protein RuvA [Patescibacteria group bacterium]
MLSYLKGTIQNKGKGYVIVLTGDIGYKIYVNDSIYAELGINQAIEFYIFHNVKEDASDLYGFYHMDQLEMFELLLSISGVGPKSAMATLGIASIEDIKESISRGDSSLLIKVSGIGKKTAERIVLELRDKIIQIADDRQQATDNKSIQASSDEIDALMALGYSLQQAREALKKIDVSIKDSGQRIKEALKGLG